MPDWDADSPGLQVNLTDVLETIARSAEARELPAVAAARQWQSTMMRGLTVRDPRYVGAFRGEPGLERTQVKVGPNSGAAANDVAEELGRFEIRLRGLVSTLDELIEVGLELDTDQLAAVVDTCAWAHSEWVRIHPFANGNGRTARLWANSIAMRYGLPPFMRLRPRPNAGYAAAGARAMLGDWKPTARVFQHLLYKCLSKA